MILTREFLISQDACQEGIQTAIDNNILGIEYNLAIRQLIGLNEQDYAGWLLEKKSTEAYVRANGREITMGTTYQVFNPITGTHTEYQTEDEAKAAIAVIGRDIFATYKPTVCRAISNENGDSVWVAVDIVQSFEVIVN